MAPDEQGLACLVDTRDSGVLDGVPATRGLDRIESRGSVEVEEGKDATAGTA